MNKCILLLFALTFHLLTVKSQDISGFVTNDYGEIFPVNAILLNPNDSTFLAGDFFVNGKFTITNPLKDKVFLKLSGISFEDTILIVPFSDTLINLDTIIVQPIVLDEVTITAYKKIFTIEETGYSVDISSTYLKDLGTAIDILKTAPGIIIDGNDNVKIIGKIKKPLIMINNREVTNREEIKSIASSSIKSIEIITEPSAKYSASETSVINITTNNNPRGLSSRLSVRGGYGEKFRHKESIDLKYESNKISAFSYYNFNAIKKTPYVCSSLISFLNEDTVELSGFNNQYQNWKTSSYAAGLDYNFNDVHKAGLHVDGYSTSTLTKEHQLNMYSKKNDFFNYSTSDRGTFDEDLINIGLTYSLLSDSEKHELSVFSNLVEYNMKTNNYITENYGDEHVISKNISKNEYKVFALKADYLYDIPNVQAKLLAGLKMSDVKGSGHINFFSLSEPDWIYDDKLSSDFTNEEKILAGYIELNSKMNKLDIKLGLRSESVSSHASDPRQSGPVIDTSYTMFFPSLSLSLPINQRNSLSFNYINKIQRPSYKYLTKTIDYLDSIRYFQGNPYLKPALFKEYSLRYSFKSTYGSRLSFIRAENFIDQFVEYDENGKLKTTYSNYDEFSGWNISVFGGIQKRWFDTRISLDYRKPNMKISQMGKIISLDKSSLYFNISGKISLWKDGMINYSYFKSTGGHYGTIKYVASSNLSLGLTQKLLKGGLVLRIIAEDLLNNMTFGGTSFVGRIKKSTIEQQDTRVFLISAVLLLNKYAKKPDKNSSVKDELNRLR